MDARHVIAYLLIGGIILIIAATARYAWKQFAAQRHWRR
tara:strand:+ start:1365 stop:1481 length:117 start_codon:yes stop_codon:yes gene_type:complete